MNVTYSKSILSDTEWCTEKQQEVDQIFLKSTIHVEVENEKSLKRFSGN